MSQLTQKKIRFSGSTRSFEIVKCSFWSMANSCLAYSSYWLLETSLHEIKRHASPSKNIFYCYNATHF